MQHQLHCSAREYAQLRMWNSRYGKSPVTTPLKPSAKLLFDGPVLRQVPGRCVRSRADRTPPTSLVPRVLLPDRRREPAGSPARRSASRSMGVAFPSLPRPLQSLRVLPEWPRPCTQIESAISSASAETFTRALQMSKGQSRRHECSREQQIPVGGGIVRTKNRNWPFSGFTRSFQHQAESNVIARDQADILRFSPSGVRPCRVENTESATQRTP